MDATRPGSRLGGSRFGWWIGDWIRYGSAKYGEKYEAAARITGYDVQSLMNMAYVASRFEISRRREKLSFSHHCELAALPLGEQELWLDRIEREGLSVHALRVQLKRSAAKLGSPPSVAEADVQAPDTQRSGGAEVVCPECGHQFAAHAPSSAGARRRSSAGARRRAAGADSSCQRNVLAVLSRSGCRLGEPLDTKSGRPPWGLV